MKIKEKYRLRILYSTTGARTVKETMQLLSIDLFAFIKLLVGV